MACAKERMWSVRVLRISSVETEGLGVVNKTPTVRDPTPSRGEACGLNKVCWCECCSTRPTQASGDVMLSVLDSTWEAHDRWGSHETGKTQSDEHSQKIGPARLQHRLGKCRRRTDMDKSEVERERIAEPWPGRWARQGFEMSCKSVLYVLRTVVALMSIRVTLTRH